MRVTPSSSDRSAKTPFPVESRRPFIPASPTSTDGAPATSVQRSAATLPSAPAQSSTPTPGAPKTPTEPSGSLETDLLRWMGLPDETPVEGRLSRKQSDTVSDLMRKAETSTARPGEGSTSQESSSDAADNASESFSPLPSISGKGFKDQNDVQRAVVIDEVETNVDAGGPGAEGGNAEEAIDSIAHRVLDMLRNRLRLERERNRKF